MQKTPRICVIDDDPTMVRLASALLTRAGYKVTEAHDADQVATVAHDGRFDLIVSDAYMPGISGARLHDLVNARAPQVAFVLMSSWPESPELKAVSESGVPVIAKARMLQALLPAVKAQLAARAS